MDPLNLSYSSTWHEIPQVLGANVNAAATASADACHDQMRKDVMRTFLRVCTWSCGEAESELSVAGNFDQFGREYIGVLQRTTAALQQARTEDEEDVAEWELLEAASSVLHLSLLTLPAAPSLALGASSQSAGAVTRTGLQQWLSKYHLPEIEEGDLSAVLAQATGPGVPTPLWRLVALLVATGEPRAAAKLLQQCNALAGDYHAVPLAELLEEHPCGSRSGAAQSRSQWAAWAQRTREYTDGLPPPSAGDDTPLAATRAILACLTGDTKPFELDGAPITPLGVLSTLLQHSGVDLSQPLAAVPWWLKCTLQLQYQRAPNAWSRDAALRCFTDALRDDAGKWAMYGPTSGVAEGDLTPLADFLSQEESLRWVALHWMHFLSVFHAKGALRTLEERSLQLLARPHTPGGLREMARAFVSNLGDAAAALPVQEVAQRTDDALAFGEERPEHLPSRLVMLAAATACGVLCVPGDEGLLEDVRRVWGGLQWRTESEAHSIWAFAQHLCACAASVLQRQQAWPHRLAYGLPAEHALLASVAKSTMQCLTAKPALALWLRVLQDQSSFACEHAAAWLRCATDGGGELLASSPAAPDSHEKLELLQWRGDDEQSQAVAQAVEAGQAALLWAHRSADVTRLEAVGSWLCVLALKALKVFNFNHEQGDHVSPHTGHAAALFEALLPQAGPGLETSLSPQQCLLAVQGVLSCTVADRKVPVSATALQVAYRLFALLTELQDATSDSPPGQQGSAAAQALKPAGAALVRAMWAAPGGASSSRLTGALAAVGTASTACPPQIASALLAWGASSGFLGAPDTPFTHPESLALLRCATALAPGITQRASLHQAGSSRPLQQVQSPGSLGALAQVHRQHADGVRAVLQACAGTAARSVMATRAHFQGQSPPPIDGTPPSAQAARLSAIVWRCRWAALGGRAATPLMDAAATLPLPGHAGASSLAQLGAGNTSTPGQRRWEGAPPAAATPFAFQSAKKPRTARLGSPGAPFSLTLGAAKPVASMRGLASPPPNFGGAFPASPAPQRGAQGNPRATQGHKAPLSAQGMPVGGGLSSPPKGLFSPAGGGAGGALGLLSATPRASPAQQSEDRHTSMASPGAAGGGFLQNFDMSAIAHRDSGTLPPAMQAASPGSPAALPETPLGSKATNNQGSSGGTLLSSDNKSAGGLLGGGDGGSGSSGGLLGGGGSGSSGSLLGGSGSSGGLLGGGGSSGGLLGGGGSGSSGGLLGGGSGSSGGLLGGGGGSGSSGGLLGGGGSLVSGSSTGLPDNPPAFL